MNRTAGEVRISPLAAGRLAPLGAADRALIAGIVTRPLFAAWGGETGWRPPVADLQLTRLALASREAAEALRILSDVRAKAVTQGKIVDILQARGELDEALRIRTEEQLPIYERLGAVYELWTCRAKIALTLLTRMVQTGHRERAAEANAVLCQALADARRLRISEAGQTSRSSDKWGWSAAVRHERGTGPAPEQDPYPHPEPLVLGDPNARPWRARPMRELELVLNGTDADAAARHKAVDPVAVAALVVSIPGAVLAALDLADRIAKRRRAKTLIETAGRIRIERRVEVLYFRRLCFKREFLEVVRGGYPRMIGKKIGLLKRPFLIEECNVRQIAVSLWKVMLKRIETMSKQARLEARIDPEIHALLKRAAEIQGRTLSDFVVSAARTAALETIERAGVIHLSLEDQQRFAAELIDPSPLAPAMERAIERHEKLIGPVD